MDKNKKKLQLILLLITILTTACSTTSTKRDNIADDKINYKKAALLNVDLGRNYLADGYTERAKRKFIHALNLMPNSAEVHSGMGYFWEVVKEYKEAEVHYRKSIALGNGKGAFYNQYAIFLCQQDRYKEADHNFSLAIKDKFYDQTSQVYANAGMCSLQNNDYKKAEKYFTKGLDHDPKRIELLLELAKMSIYKKEYKIAENYLQQFYTLNNKPTAKHLFLSIKVATMLGQEDVAASKALVLKNLFPDSIEYNTYKNDINKDAKHG